MRDLRELDKEQGVKRLPFNTYSNLPNLDPEVEGGFVINCKEVELFVIASSGLGWDHLSISTKDRCPSWEEMEHIAKLFFKSEEVAMQLHLPEKDHLNYHEYVLHWWRPRSKLKKIPLPPKILV